MTRAELFELLRYFPHAAQLTFHDSDARFKVLIAGARFGKSLAAARETLLELLSGTTRGWLVGPTYALTMPEFRYIRDDLYARLHAEPAERADPPRLVAPWGGQVIALSAQQPESLLGREIDWLILCEAANLKRDAFERFLRARLSTRSGRLVVPTTPRGHNWIEQLYERGRDDEPGWESFRHATWENPNIPASEIESARRSLPQDTFAEQYGGEFTSPAGRVYREFRRELHVGKLQAPPGALVYKAIDFGYAAPFACLWGAPDADGRLLILHEHYQARQGIDQHAEVIRAVDDSFVALGCRIGPAFADPAGALERKLLADAGVRTLKADNRLRGGIEVVRRLLLPRTDGTPGLLIDAGCVNLLRELECYLWGEDVARPAPGPGDDHALDALRYLCVALARKVDWQNPGTLW
ncbi:MAG: terminase family protein [Planctomycetota bacterium]|nr:terminase family protein [Planctomycetota bacterium]